MTVKELRVLVENLDEYIRIPGGIGRLRKTILHLAVSGQLVPQDIQEGTGHELLKSIVDKESYKSLKTNGSDFDSVQQPDAFPKTWATTQLGSICTFEYGKGLDKGDRTENGAYVAYGANGPLSRSDKWLIRSRAIIIGRKGSAGAVNLYDGPLWPTDVTYYVPEGQYGAFDLEYLELVLRSLDLPALANGIKPGLNRNDAYRKIIGLPPIAEQKRILNKTHEILIIIDELEAQFISEELSRKRLVQASLHSLVSKKDKLALSLLKEIIRDSHDTVKLEDTILSLAVRGLLVEQHSLDPQGQQKKEVVDDQDNPYTLPSSWEWVNLASHATLVNGFAFKSEQWKKSGLPIVRIQNLNNESATYNFVDEETVSPKYIIDSGQILLSWSGTPGTSFGVFIWNRGKAALNQHIFKCNVKGMRPEYFRIAANKAINEKLDTAHGGVGLKHLTKKQIDALRLPLPPLEEQDRIIEKVKQIFSLTKILSSTLNS